MYNSSSKFDDSQTESIVMISIYSKDKIFDIYCSLWSLINQTEKNFLIMICLDGEIDLAVRKLINYYKINHQNISIISNFNNIGLASSLNRIIEICIKSHPNIQYYFRMDADDICLLNRFELQLKFLKSYPHVDILGGACKEFGIYNKTIIKPKNDYEIKKKILKITPFIHPSVVFRKRVFLSGIRYPEKTHLSEDLALWLTLAKRGFIFHNLEDVILYYRLNSNTLKRRMNLKKAISELISRLNYLSFKKDNLLLNSFYIISHFVIRLLPICVTKILYRILR